MMYRPMAVMAITIRMLKTRTMLRPRGVTM